MIATAQGHEQLKQAAGERLSGRPLEQPVMTISLSWHPSEKPDRAEIERAADSYLKHMGLDEHQAVYLAHNDTEHAHVHIIVNRVHPERGKVHDDAFSKNRSQMWAAEYEREQGRIWCQERIGKDYTKANDGPPRGLPNREAIDAREEARHYAALEAGGDDARCPRKGDSFPAATRRSARRSSRPGTSNSAKRARRPTGRCRQEYRERWVEHFREADAVRQEAERKGTDLADQIMQLAREEDFAAAWQTVCRPRHPSRGRREADRRSPQHLARPATRDHARAAGRGLQGAL